MKARRGSPGCSITLPLAKFPGSTPLIRNHTVSTMDSVRAKVAEDRSVPAQGLWPWAVFTVALAAGLVLFFVYPPR